MVMIRYPNGKTYKPLNTSSPSPKKLEASYSNRGMTLEDDLDETNEYYVSKGIAIVHKKPTPVQIVKVDYPKRSAAVIKEAYFKQASTTDYNGVYKGKHLDFEAKETRNKTEKKKKRADGLSAISPWRSALTIGASYAGKCTR